MDFFTARKKLDLVDPRTHKQFMFRKFTLLTILFLPYPLMACSVCFGGADSNLIRGFTWGVGILLGLPFILLAGLGGMIVYSARKHKRHVQARP